MNTPLAIGTSYGLRVSRRRATSSAQCPEAQRAAHLTSARSPEKSPLTITPDTVRYRRGQRESLVPLCEELGFSGLLEDIPMTMQRSLFQEDGSRL